MPKVRNVVYATDVQQRTENHKMKAGDHIYSVVVLPLGWAVVYLALGRLHCGDVTWGNAINR